MIFYKCLYCECENEANEENLDEYQYCLKCGGIHDIDFDEITGEVVIEEF